MELNNLAQANKIGIDREWEFNEWLDGKNGKPKGTPHQGWSAGAYIYAFECLKKKEALFYSGSN